MDVIIGMSEGTQVELNGLKSLVESLIFVADAPVTVHAIGQALECDDDTIERALAALAGEYESRGFRLQRTRDRVQLVSAPEAAPHIQKFLGLDGTARLSGAALETLAIIAYRQPVTRTQIEAIRGVNCDGVVHSLLARGLIEEIGRLETVGHPIQYGTTFEFLQYFGLTSVLDLPPLPDDAIFESSPRDLSQLLSGRSSSEVGSNGASDARPEAENGAPA